LIKVFGPFPAYLLLAFVCLHYVFFDRGGKKGLRQFRTRLGLEKNDLVSLYRHYYTFGTALIDRITFLVRQKHPFHYTCVNENLITDARGRGRGAILLSAHIGNWEIAGNLLHKRLDTPINLVMLDNEQQWIKEVFREVTTLRNVTVIPITQNSLDMMIQIRTVLAANQLVCFHGDRVLGSSGVQKMFLGALAEFPAGPFQIAAITGAPVIPVFTIKTGLTSYTFQASAPILFENVSRQNRQNTIETAMETYIKILETMARRYPYQWYNFYEFWG
jgi:predicted LPLAT superfamily acyltransferase